MELSDQSSEERDNDKMKRKLDAIQKNHDRVLGELYHQQVHLFELKHKLDRESRLPGRLGTDYAS